MNKALLVGINEYPSAPLQGCVNDVNDVANLLVNVFGFSSSDIRLLVDARATTGAILDRLNWLVDVPSESRILFYYSGHGAQVPVRNGDTSEIDGLNEVICPVDFDWSPECMITDKDFVHIFSRIPPKVAFNWVSDSCHSGDLSRAFRRNPDRSKHFPIPADIAWQQRIIRDKHLSASNRGLTGGMLDVGYISGCKSDQTSSDASFGGRPNGALTYFLLRELNTISNLDTIVNNVRTDLFNAGYDQIPQAEGPQVKHTFLGCYDTTLPLPPEHPLPPVNPPRPSWLGGILNWLRW